MLTDFDGNYIIWHYKKNEFLWLILKTNGFSFSFCPQNHILLPKQGLLLFNSVFRCTLVWTSKLWFISRFWEVAYFRRPLNRKNCVGSCALVHKVVRKDQIIIYHQSKPVNKSSSSSYFIKYAFLRPNYGTHTLVELEHL